jgi:O-antigen/teichoic acid export membrane protein
MTTKNASNHRNSMLSTFRPALAYLVSIALTKGLSLVTVPIFTRYLVPADFAQLEVFASLLEFIGLVAALGLADTLFRYAASHDDSNAQARVASGLFGAGIVTAASIAITVLPFGEVLRSSFGGGFSLLAFDSAIIGAALTGVVTLPLAWMRFSHRPMLFMSFTVARGLAQMLVSVTALSQGSGIDGVVFGNAMIELASAAALIFWQMTSTGISVDRNSLRQCGVYGLPLVGASLAMFAVGNLDRWFLVNYVAPGTLAEYALALKLALATPLLIQPFLLWWYPLRLSWLRDADGLDRNARAAGCGFAFLVASGVFVCFAGSAFISLALPKAYSGAAVFLPMIVFLCGLNELTSFVNIGSYQGDNGYRILAINLAAATIALVGYTLTIPHFGVWGAIASTALAQAARVVIFVVVGSRSLAMPYPYGRMAILAALAVIVIAFRPDVTSWWVTPLYGSGALLVCNLAAVVLGLYALPTFRARATLWKTS